MTGPTVEDEKVDGSKRVDAIDSDRCEEENVKDAV